MSSKTNEAADTDCFLVVESKAGSFKETAEVDTLERTFEAAFSVWCFGRSKPADGTNPFVGVPKVERVANATKAMRWTCMME